MVGAAGLGDVGGRFGIRTPCKAAMPAFRPALLAPVATTSGRVMTDDVARFGTMSALLCETSAVPGALHLEEEAADLSQWRFGTHKQLVVFFGSAGIGMLGS
ncbi:hypothetical protein HaLaN_03736 [Haematococcus lacustris]|uniref:Uncharacterized protein n=1 Tax=Haematococcus lacustris TaxID=44745 RepID=A0A699YF98_HAELA|nr:hypothetical protein HaLaN_03736 [Haematococcus lacustris]